MGSFMVEPVIKKMKGTVNLEVRKYSDITKYEVQNFIINSYIEIESFHLQLEN